MNRMLVIKGLGALMFFAATVLFAPQGQAQPLPQLVGDTVKLTLAEQQQVDFMHQPEDWFIARLKGPREKSDGGVLDARLQYVLENVTRPAAALQPAIRAAYATPEGRANGRAALERYWLIRTQGSADMQSVSGQVIKGRDGNDIALRIYRPVSKDKTLPVLVYYHGGGFMFGSLEGWDRTAREIANAAQMIVVSADYRLAPENPYPAAWNDAEDVYQWAVANAATLRASRIAVGGDSAGGTLAIAVALRQVTASRREPEGLMLYYPGVDREGDYPSLHAFGTGYALDADNLKYLAGQVYPDGSRTTPADTSPLQADHLCRLPATLVVTAGFDPLRDSQRAFAAKLSDPAVRHGVTRTLDYPSLIHGFQQTSGYVPDAEKAVAESSRVFGEMMRQSGRGPKPCP